MRRSVAVRQIDTSSPDVLRRELGRTQGDLDELLRSLQELYAPRWKVGARVTANTTRSSCGLRFYEMRVVDTRSGSVRLYLPRASEIEAGWECGFIKQIPTGAVQLQPAGGALINGLSSLESLTQVGFYYIMWDGRGWHVREPIGRVQAHPLTTGTQQLYQLNARSLADSSGHGRTLTVETGTERYGYINGTLGAFHFNGDTSLIYNTADATLRSYGDGTWMFLWLTLANVTNGFFFSHVGDPVSETEANNYIYGLRTPTPPNIGWIQESGAGVNATATLASSSPMVGVLSHVAVTRASGVMQLYWQGRVFGPASGALTTPTGSTSGRFRLGSDSGSHINGLMTSFKYVNRAYSAAEVMAERNYCLGGVQGYIDAF